MKHLGLAALVVIAACAHEIELPQAPEGQMIFAESCAACHGADATGGNGLVAGKRPPDLTGIAARNDGVFPRARVLSTIDGYRMGSHDRPMPEFGAALTGDLVPVEVNGTLTPTPRPLAALLTYLESVQD